RQQRQSDCPWVFPGRSYQTKGKKVYSKRYMFEQIEKKTGIHLRPKDLRDYFATEVASKVSDPTVIMKLLRHTNLRTTTGYLRTVENRMRAAVENLGAASGGVLGAVLVPKTDQNELRARIAELTKLLIAQGFYDENENGEKQVRVAS